MIHPLPSRLLLIVMVALLAIAALANGGWAWDGSIF
jgi:hypothetical protein